jgi:beta-xylosidase
VFICLSITANNQFNPAAMQQIKTFISYIILVLLSPLTLFAQLNDGAVIAGDFADPSIIKVDKTYFAVGTSSEWAPHFPIFKSTDLKNWSQAGYVFDKAPEWTSGSFWAPEYYKIKDTYYIYYTARRKSDDVSYIGVATSKYPDKGFTDHGTFITFGKEAIDAFLFNDNGQLYITFKAYGLDKRPIEILGYKLSADGLKLEGEPFSLLKDDQKIGMEGQSILKKGDYYYLFYSAGGCCGVRCSYNVRVARSKNFAGPYEFYANNPILSENDKWKCMGHGTFVKGDNGADFYIHHAYNKESVAITGRQGLISELVWPNGNEWPAFKSQQVVGGTAPNITEDFTAKTIDKNWQWDFRNSTPVVKQQKGVLYLSGTTKPGNETGIVVTQRPVSGSFVMTATVLNNNAALKGLSFYGDANAAIGIGTENNQVVLWQVKGNKFAALTQQPIQPKSPVQLKLELDADKTCKLYYKQGTDDWKQLITETPVKANGLPQWDRSPRAGLHFKGDASLNGQFSGFSIVNK